VTLPPDQRVKKLIEMQPAEFRDFLQHLSRPDRVAMFADLSPEQKETFLRLINPQLVVGGELLVTRVLRDIYSERQLEAVDDRLLAEPLQCVFEEGRICVVVSRGLSRNKVIRPHAMESSRTCWWRPRRVRPCCSIWIRRRAGAAFAGGVAVADGAERAGGQSADGGSE